MYSYRRSDCGYGSHAQGHHTHRQSSGRHWSWFHIQAPVSAVFPHPRKGIPPHVQLDLSDTYILWHDFSHHTLCEVSFRQNGLFLPFFRSGHTGMCWSLHCKDLCALQFFHSCHTYFQTVFLLCRLRWSDTVPQAVLLNCIHSERLLLSHRWSCPQDRSGFEAWCAPVPFLLPIRTSDFQTDHTHNHT